ncbi:hypothetical protein [Butyricimonas synergistica]|nr:hypothetical protein [Butyricimonas synergistica]
MAEWLPEVAKAIKEQEKGELNSPALCKEELEGVVYNTSSAPPQ